MTQTFSQVAALWKADKAPYIKKSSYATYSFHLNAHLLPYFGPMTSVPAEAVQAFADSRLAEGLSIKTVRDMLLVLKMVLRFGEKMGAWPHAEYTVRFKADDCRSRPLQVFTAAQQKRLFRYLHKNASPLNLGLIISLQCGLRIGEVCGLKWRDLNTHTGEISVRRTVQRIWLAEDGTTTDTLLVGTPKTSSSVRDIPVSHELLELIRLLRKEARPGDYMLTSAADPMEPRSYRRYFRRVLRQLGIPQLRFHALRHSFATRCIESRCDYKTISAILGHSSLATTMDLYVHPGYKDKKRCIEQMAKALRR